MARRGLRLFVAVALVLGLGWTWASCDRCGEWPTGAPAMHALGRAVGPLRVGAAAVDIAPRYPVTVGGYGPLRSSASSAAAPVRARAVVIEVSGERVALVELDVLLVTERLRVAIADGAGFPVWLVASHAHSSMGGYDPRLASQLVALGGYSADDERALVDAGRAALEKAKASLTPAAVAVDSGTSAVAVARSGAGVDERLTRIRFVALGTTAVLQAPAVGGAQPVRAPAAVPGEETPGTGAELIRTRASTPPALPLADATATQLIRTGAPAAVPPGDDAPRTGASTPPAAPRDDAPRLLAQLIITAAHPTLVAQRTSQLDPDWPGRVAELAPGAVTLVLQGAAGNASPARDAASTPDAFAKLVASALDALPRSEPQAATALTWAEVTLPLPRPDASRLVPGFLRAAAENVLCDGAERELTLTALRVGPASLLLVPVEPSAAAGRVLEEQAQLSRVVSLANGYAGYVDTDQAVRAGSGEASRQYFPAELLRQLADAARLAGAAARTTP